MPADLVDKSIQKKWKQPWNQDNFGPIIVPANSYFVLGDNRLDAMDSRYIGYVTSEQVTGGLLD